MNIDKTFCASDCTNKNCDRYYSGLVANLHFMSMKQASMQDFSKDCKDYVKPLDNLISDCGCRFKNERSSAVILCEECSKLPCHNPPR